MTQADPKPSTGQTLSPLGSAALALMRIAIGWHFLYEGVAKLLMPSWTAAGYLQDSTGPAAPLFHWLSNQATLMKVVDQMNMWGLTLIGLCLMLGLLTRFAALCGIALLALYYAANPPLFHAFDWAPMEGHYLLVNKNLVELLALVVVLVLPAASLGLDGLLVAMCPYCRRRAKEDVPTATPPTIVQPAACEPGFSRRRLIVALAGVPFVGGIVLAMLKRHGWVSFEEKLLGAKKADATSGATLKISLNKSLKDLKGTLPQGKIKNLSLSRVILGGNLMGGWAHARDLIYVSSLVKAYHHRLKIFETFRIAEACGVNTILTNPVLSEVINDYWRSTGGKIQFISDCAGKDFMQLIQKSIDGGASACYVQGGVADNLVANGKFDQIAKALELIRKNGLPAGIGGHKLETVKGCRDKGLIPDFWMKTFHHGKYWSSFGGEEEKNFAHDHFWCQRPDEVVSYMKEVQEPWIAFKILAAGALHPRDGFRFAFEGGADFICVGMYDFQIVEDVNIALDVLAAKSKFKRQREWRA
jgi:uncharacterized membrane protein YphA (DoxX/SURF4 family)